MSEHSAAVAAALGVPEDLVIKSATARAQASGSTTEEVLAAWSGGGEVPAAAPSATPPATDEAQAATPPATDPAPADMSPEPEETGAESPLPVEGAPVSSPGGSGPVTVIDRRAKAAPILTGRRDRPLLVLAGLVALFVLGAVFAVSLPGAEARNLAADQLPGTTPQLSELAQEGREIYLTEGCFYCHTQLVRSVVTDVGLGTVTEPGTAPSLSPETYGFQRVGPDLTHVGSREPTNDAAWLRSYLEDPTAERPGTLQPSYAYLSDNEMDALVQFLLESE